MKKTLRVVLLFVMAGASAQAQPGFLDPGFDNDGIVRTGFGGSDELGYCVALQADGKIVVGGYTSNPFALDYDLALARYNPDGSFDLSFGQAGMTTLAIGDDDDVISDIILQPDGKILVVGSYANSIGSDFVLARLDTLGMPDPTFGSAGIVITDYQKYDVANAIALQPDGKILAVGQTRAGTKSAFAVARYHPNGDLDPTFDTDGWATFEIDLGSLNEVAYDIEIRPNGKILLVGTLYYPMFRFHGAAVQLLPNGQLDASFGSAGFVVDNASNSGSSFASALLPNGNLLASGYAGALSIDFLSILYDSTGARVPFPNGLMRLLGDVTGSHDFAKAVALQPDGRFVVAGYGDNGTSEDFAVMRYNASGDLDTSFSYDAKLITDIIGGIDIPGGVVLQPDGKIIVAGYTELGTDNDFALVRYLSGGNLDSTFDIDGIVTTEFLTPDGANAVAIQSNGRIITTGQTRGELALLRYKKNGALDDAFGLGNGKQITSIGTTAIGRGVVMNADHSVVVASEAVIANSRSVALSKYNTLGKTVLGFGTAGVRTATIAQGCGPFGITLQPDGKMLVAGWADNGHDLDFAVMRFDPRGDLDNTFGNAGSVITVFGDGDNVARGLVLQPDGKIVIGGYAAFRSSYDNSDLYYNLAAARYNADGTLDKTFNDDGVVSTAVGANATGHAVAVDQLGRVLVAGTSDGQFAIVRYKPNGQCDGTFGNNGVVTTAIGASAVANGVVTQPDGKIVVAGTVDHQFAVVRYNDDGSLDEGFGLDGMTVTPIGDHASAQAVALGIDGKIIVVGRSAIDDDYDVTVACYGNDLDLGVLDEANETPVLLVYPNPMASGATVGFELNQAATVTASLFDTQGRECGALFTVPLPSGSHQVPFELAPSLPDGSYFLVIYAGGEPRIVQVFKTGSR
jgi:uncharacterized delta-60 repeat protein